MYLCIIDTTLSGMIFSWTTLAGITGPVAQQGAWMMLSRLFFWHCFNLTTLAGITGPVAQQGLPGQAHQVQPGRAAPRCPAGLQRERRQGVSL